MQGYMNEKKRKIGILTSGGDCAGLNAVLHAVVRATHMRGWELVGIPSGVYGLVDRPLHLLPIDRFFGGPGEALLRQGGTILGSTNKGDPFALQMPDGSTQDVSDAFIEGYRNAELDALIGIGGDGSLSKLERLCRKGNIPLVGIPKTIDNDILLTEALGFETAVEIATEAVDRLHPTGASHQRVMILEVMGRHAGHIALRAGLAGGADLILVPEIPFLMEKVTAHIQCLLAAHQRSVVIVASEAAHPLGWAPSVLTDQRGTTRYHGIGNFLESQLNQSIDRDVRATVLGHVQRGAPPIARDRLLAAAFGAKAVDLIEGEQFNYMVAWQEGMVKAIPLAEALSTYGRLSPQDSLIQVARTLGISFGD